MRITPRLAGARPWNAHGLPGLRSLMTAFTLACMLVCMPALSPLNTLAAQGRIVGEVRDTGGAGIFGAQISIAGSGLRTNSDTAGRFVLAGVPAGTTTLLVRRLGFAPASVTVLALEDSTVHTTVTITEVAPGLAPVVVRAARPVRYTGYLAGFHERRDQGFGHFITGDEIEEQNPYRLTDMLRTIPGINLSPTGTGSRVRMRGNRCAPLVWLDGAPASAAEFDVDVLVPTSVAGIEIYPGIAGVPPQFVMPFGRTACGTIIIWSRRGEPREKSTMTVAELTSLLTSLQVYTADQVDEPVRADTAAPVVPTYPEELYKSRTPGQVIVEFVVDTMGKAEPETFGVVSSTDARFTQAVRVALADARFRPAVLAGRKVRQIVRQPFSFVVPAGGSRPRG